MQNYIQTTQAHQLSPLWLKLSCLLSVLLLITSCGKGHPSFTHFKAFDQHFTTVLDTKDAEQLALLSELFYDRQPANDVQADLSFDYLFDVSHSGGSERWRCTKNGYCQQRLEGAEAQTEMFYVERYKELYQVAKLK